MVALVAFSMIKPRSKKANKAEREHMGRVADLGCIVCINENLGPTPACCHHIRHQVGAGRRASHFQTLPLCPAHHQYGGYGVAYHAGPVVWQEKYGTELELLAQVQEMLG